MKDVGSRTVFEYHAVILYQDIKTHRLNEAASLSVAEHSLCLRRYSIVKWHMYALNLAVIYLVISFLKSIAFIRRAAARAICSRAELAVMEFLVFLENNPRYGFCRNHHHAFCQNDADIACDIPEHAEKRLLPGHRPHVQRPGID